MNKKMQLVLDTYATRGCISKTLQQMFLLTMQGHRCAIRGEFYEGCWGKDKKYYHRRAI